MWRDRRSTRFLWHRSVHARLWNAGWFGLGEGGFRKDLHDECFERRSNCFNYRRSALRGVLIVKQDT